LSGPGVPQPGLTYMRENSTVVLPPDELDEPPTLELERGWSAPGRRVVRLERSTPVRRRTVTCLLGCVAASALAVALLRRSVGEDMPHPKVGAGSGHVMGARRCAPDCGVNTGQPGKVVPRLHVTSTPTRCRSSSVRFHSRRCSTRHRRGAGRHPRRATRDVPSTVDAKPRAEVPHVPAEAERPPGTSPPSAQRAVEPAPVPARGRPAERKRQVNEFNFEEAGR
jgi:hypothetical protein